VSVILVIDEHSVYRSGIRALIEARVQHARVVEASEFESFAANQYFDLILFDLILIDSGSLSYRLLDVLKEVHEVSSATRFAVMSTSNIRADVLSCLSAGFHGFVHKFQSDEDLLTAINDLLSGRIYVPRWLADGDVDRPEVPPSFNTQVEILKLTRRQKEVLPLIAQGMSNKEIASHLNIAEGTTKIHTAALLRALGARNRTEAAFMAAKLVGPSIRSGDRYKSERFMIKGLIGDAEGSRAARR
jgi:DNA-binding NarL/FixJ family response regulator